MKVLVTGCRKWDDVETVLKELQQFPSGTIIVHGGCKGADITAGVIAEELGFTVHSYLAQWDRYNFGAGPIRNQQMIDEEHRHEEPINLCLAFHDSISTSKGTADMVTRARRALITCRIVSSSNKKDNK